MRNVLLVIIVLIFYGIDARAEDTEIINDIQVSANSGSNIGQNTSEGRVETDIKIKTEINANTIVDDRYYDSATSSLNISIEQDMEVNGSEIITEESLISSSSLKKPVSLDEKYLSEKQIIDSESVSVLNSVSEIGIEEKETGLLLEESTNGEPSEIIASENGEDIKDVKIINPDTDMINETSTARSTDNKYSIVFGILGLMFISFLTIFKL